MNARAIRLLLGGERNPLSLVLRFLLLPLSLAYLAAVTVRNALFDNGLLRQVDVGVPVVSVGNVTVGGAGKTPLVIALARKALAEGRRVAVVCRGYGGVADGDGRTDEVALLAARCPGADVIMAPSKLAGARAAAAGGADLILVDDGMQHRRLARDVEIVVVDARAPFGNGELLPTGTLREPPSGLARADVIVVTHSEEVAPDVLGPLGHRLRAHDLSEPLLFARHAPVGVRAVAGGELHPPGSLAGQELFLFCGIASPDGFRHTVEALGARVTGMLAFPDHHDFRPADLARVRARARTASLLCTEKDAVKLARIPDVSDVRCLVVDLALDGELPALPPKRAPAAAADGEAHGHH